MARSCGPATWCGRSGAAEPPKGGPLHLHLPNAPPELQPPTTPDTTILTKPVILQWLTHLQQLTGLSQQVLTLHTWQSYNHSVPDNATFVAHALVVGSLAGCAAGGAGGAGGAGDAGYPPTETPPIAAPPQQPTTIYASLSQPNMLIACAELLQIRDIGCPTTPEGLEMSMYRLYSDQLLRFTYIHNELRHASTPRGSALSALYATFDPIAQARGVVDKVMGRVVRHIMKTSAPSSSLNATTAKERIHSYFRRSYADAPRVRIEMTTEGVYRCTVMQLDGAVMGIGEGTYREVAVEMGFVEAEKVVF